MNLLTVLLYLAGLLPTVVQSPPAKVTLLRVEGSAFGEEEVFTITADSVLVDKVFLLEDGDQRRHYRRALTSQQHDDLLSSFNSIYLSQLKSNYERRGAQSHMMSYAVFIHKGEAVKHMSIYGYKLTPFYVFSQKLNRLLPHAFQLDSYNGSYFND